MTNNNEDILGKVKGVNVFTTPEGYFNDLAAGIMSTIQLEAGRSSSQQGPYFIPDGYFDDLSSTILARLHALPDDQLSLVDTVTNDFLATVGKANVYEVPPGYFAQLPAQLTEQVMGAEKGKVFSFRSVTRKWFSYASAAAVAGVMVVAAFLFTDDNQQKPSTYYNGFKNIDVKKGVSDLSESEISTYLTAHPAIFEVPAPGAATAEAAIQRSIKTISEEEISTYLQENWEPGESPLKGI